MKKSLLRKNYARLLGIIGQSKDALFADKIVELMKQFDPSSDWRYVYEMLEDLCPSRVFEFGTRMFCVNDLFSEDFSSRQKSSLNLIKKLRKGHEERSKRDEEFKTYHFFEKNHAIDVEKNENGEIRKVIIEDDDENKIEVEGAIPSKEIISNSQVVVTIVYSSRYFPNIQVATNPKVMIPLVLKKKGGKVYAYRPLLNDDAPIQFLEPLSTKNSGDRNGPSVNYRSNPSDLENNIASSKKYRLNLRGLMLLILSEDNFLKVNDVLANLIETDRDVEFKEDSSGLSHTIKENFPFLSRYFIEFQRVVREDFAFIALKKVAGNVKDKLGSVSMKELKKIVTREYYTQIEKFYWSKNNLIFETLDLNLYGYKGNFKDIWTYKLSILYFIRKSIEQDLSLVNEMIKGNELAANTNLKDWRYTSR